MQELIYNSITLSDDITFFLIKHQNDFGVLISKCYTCESFYNKYISYFFLKKYFIYTNTYIIYSFTKNGDLICIMLHYSNIIAI